jgi:hypothetical protein
MMIFKFLEEKNLFLKISVNNILNLNYMKKD